MRTSATGPCERAERGFTLVEVMVALVIMGLLTGVVLMAVPDGGPRLSDEAERLGARLTHAREEALVANRSVEVVLTPGGYAFRERRRGAWAPLEDGPFKAQAWPEGLQVAVDSADGRSAVRFDSTGAADPVTIRLSTRAGAVRLVVDAQGEVRVDDRAG